MKDIDLMAEIVIATTSALGEQLDLDRAILAIKKQRDAIEGSGAPRADEIVEVLDRVGIAFVDILGHREARNRPRH